MRLNVQLAVHCGSALFMASSTDQIVNKKFESTEQITTNSLQVGAQVAGGESYHVTVQKLLLA